MQNVRHQNAYLCIAFLILVFSYATLVWPALSGSFVFDDFPNLQNLQLLGDDAFANLGLYLASFTGSPGRPIAALSFLINDNAWPSDPFGFKYTNLMIHLLNGVLLFGLLRQLAKANPILPQSPFWPLLAMAAWLYHPLHLSAQMLVVQRMTLLSAMFCLAGLWAYIGILLHSRRPMHDFAAVALLGIATILAFLSKENGAILPLFAWVLNATLLKEILDQKTVARRRFIRAASILPSLALFAAILYMGTLPGTFATREFDMHERLMTQAHVLADYLRQILMPRISGSGIYFDDYQITRSWINPISTLALTIIYLLSLIFAIIKRSYFPVLSFAILWFFAGHVLESSILDLELYFEHRNYLPLLGPVMALSVWAFQSLHSQRVGIVLFLFWLLLLTSITFLQAPVWGHAKLMTELWAKERPMSLRATQELAKNQYENGRPQAAADTMMNAYQRGVVYADLPMSTLLASCWHPEIKRTENIYSESLKSALNSPYSNSVLATLMLSRQAAQTRVCPNSITPSRWLALTEALLANPKFRAVAESYIRTERGKLFIEQRDLNLTMVEFERAYATRPSIELTQKIAETLLSAGLTTEAATWLTKGIELDQPFIDSLMFDPKTKSREMLDTIGLINQRQAVPIKKEIRR